MGIRLTRLISLAGLWLLFGSTQAPLAAQRESEFMIEFVKATAKSDKQLADKLIKQNHEEAILAIEETCQLISEQSSAQLELEMASLAASWRRVYKTDFADSQYKYFSLMKPQIRSVRKELINRYTKLYAQYLEAVETKTGRGFPGFGIEFQGMSEEFKKLGDLYMASVTAEVYAYCFDENLNGDKAELKRACEGYGLVVEYREQLGLKGKAYQRSKAAFDELELQGFGDPEKGPEGRKRAKAEADPSYRSEELPMVFEVAPDFEDLDRPNYGADSIYQVWHLVSLTRVGTTGKINQLGALSPDVLRQAAAKVAVDSDGDGEGDTPILVNGNLNTVQVSVGKGEAKRAWAFQAVTGSSSDTVQGIQPFNLASDELNMGIYVAPAASLVGMIGETRIQLIDDNMDGMYGSEPLGWGLLGLRKGDNQIEVDTLVIGDAKRAIPWSQKVKLGEDWYGLFPKADGTGLSYSKVDVEVGKVKLDMKGLKANYMLIQGTGNNKALCFDISTEKQGVEVPVGTYSLLAGMVSKGQRSQKMKAIVLPTSALGLIKVEAGATATLTLGAPFGFDFVFTQNASQVTVDGSEVVVTGSAGETYQRLWNCRVQPEVSLRKEDSKKGSKGEKMRLASNQNELTDGGYELLWGPYDLQLEKKKEEKVEVQLVEKKNDLFGKITSEWKKE